MYFKKKVSISSKIFLYMILLHLNSIKLTDKTAFIESWKYRMFCYLCFV